MYSCILTIDAVYLYISDIFVSDLSMSLYSFTAAYSISSSWVWSINRGLFKLGLWESKFEPDEKEELLAFFFFFLLYSKIVLNFMPIANNFISRVARIEFL